MMCLLIVLSQLFLKIHYWYHLFLLLYKFSHYYRVKKAKPLYNRLIKYKQNHLYFIEDFNIPFDDNLSERDLRIFKNKTKISGGFRSISVAKDFANALSVIKTSIKRDINPYDTIKSIFNNEVLFAN